MKIVHIQDGKITIQEANYIEDGCYIEIVGKIITLFEIPMGGGTPIKIGEFETLIEAINKSESLT